MEESNLMRERLHAITEKHRVQEDIRQKKEELDREKLKLQHIKKTSLREQWLLQGVNTHNAPSSAQQQQQQQSSRGDQQETKALQLRIHRIQMDILSLEREESIISTNESFILDRLKAVERSPEAIIKEAQSSFVLDPPQVTPVVTEVPECTFPTGSHQHEPAGQRQTLFAMEINVSKNLLTGESTVLSTASVSADKLTHHNGLKVYDDGRKCVYALNSQEGSHDRGCISELSASEVEQLLRRANMHRQIHHQNYSQPQSRTKELHSYHHHNEWDGAGRGDIMSMCGFHGDCLPKNNQEETDLSWQRRPNSEHCHSHHHRRPEEKNNQSNLRNGHHHGDHSGLRHHGNHRGRHYSYYELRDCPSGHDRPSSCYTNRVSHSNCRVMDRASDRPPPRSHDQEVLSPYQQQLCYTPANHIPLSDYITVEEEELYCLSQPSDHNGNHPTALYVDHTPLDDDSTPLDRVPSPVFEDNAPFTVLNTVDTTEPITAIFMGFQTALDDSRQGQDYEGALKAELVIIQDNDEDNHHDPTMETNSHVHPAGGINSYQPGRVNNGDLRPTQGPGSGIKKIQKKHRHCCTVC